MMQQDNIFIVEKRYDGTLYSLMDKSHRPHNHPNQHTDAKLNLIRDMRRRNPKLGMVEPWHRLKQRGYSRRSGSLFRVMRKLGSNSDIKAKWNVLATNKPSRCFQRHPEGFSICGLDNSDGNNDSILCFLETPGVVLRRI